MSKVLDFEDKQVDNNGAIGYYISVYTVYTLYVLVHCVCGVVYEANPSKIYQRYKGFAVVYNNNKLTTPSELGII